MPRSLSSVGIQSGNGMLVVVVGLVVVVVGLVVVVEGLDVVVGGLDEVVGTFVGRVRGFSGTG